MNRVEQAKLNRFYMHVLEYFENRGRGENTVTSLLAGYVTMPTNLRHALYHCIARAQYFVVGERDGKAQTVNGFSDAMERFGQELEEKVLSLQGER